MTKDTFYQFCTQYEPYRQCAEVWAKSPNYQMVGSILIIGVVVIIMMTVYIYFYTQN